MRTSFFKSFALAGALLVGLAAQAQATPVTWNFSTTGTQHSPTGSNHQGDGLYRTWSFTTGGHTVTARGFYTNSASGTFVDPTNDGQTGGGLGRYEGGLGLTNSSGEEHTVDNEGRFDFIVFQLDANNWDALSVTLAYLTDDADTTILTGGTTNMSLGSFVGQSLASLVGMGFTQYNNLVTESSLGNELTVYIPNQNGGVGGTPGAFVIVGGNVTQSNDLDDTFKIKNLTANLPSPNNAVPEPTTLALAGVGAAGLALGRKGRRQGA